ncbi:restriction endonuclease subunit S [Stutzerimonas stutzeri]|uniref:restriction endonuclease subunit S n=1 Tax=Stutzerimonas stutzeri TaxID=316 RepID=UPI00244C1E74|nr:restriction endonuclease subunit S [Stutzerimonas stutzeri]MDH0081701.1 restriction endonuclease subunit S [Stutzerimonas stutzeri]
MRYPVIPIKELARLQSGYAFKSHDWSKTGIPVVRIKNIKDGQLDLSDCAYVSEAVASAVDRYKIACGDILFSMTGYIGERAWVGASEWIMLNQRVGRFIFDQTRSSEINRKYFFYVLGYIPVLQALQNRAHGAAQPNISPSAVGEVSIPLPPLDSQGKIAAILSTYDDLIENNTRRIEILEEMARRLYEEWFVQFRFPGHEGVKFKESELGLIPEGWDLVPLGDIYRTGSGGTPSRKNPEFYGGDYRWVKTKELQDCPVFDTEERISEEGLKKSSAKLFPRNTVLIAMYGATIGRLGVLQEESATNQACCAILPNSQGCGWGYAYLSLFSRRQALIDLRAGAAQQNISQDVIKRFRLLRASDELHNQFEMAVTPFLTLCFALYRKNANLRAQRDLLLPKLISGEIDVSDIPMPT